MLSFVYDIADFYKVEVVVPLAFRLAATVTEELERRVRLECRTAFHQARLMERILPDIAEVLHVTDDSGESAEELEGRAVSLADRASDGRLPGESEPAGEGGVMEDGDEESW
jgi:CRISP-associated protein Cas1